MMSEDEFDTKPISGFRTYVAPNSPTLGVFRLETTDGLSQAFVVTKEIALELSKALASLSDGIAEFQ